MKFNFRKIASALASTAMIGSTVALAAAANYPAPFVSGGAADVAIVYGNSLDLAAVTDISTSLSSALASGGTAAGASSGAYGLFTGSTPLQLNNSISSVRSTITESNLPTVFADGDFSGNVDADITYQLVMGSHPRVIFAKEPTNNEDPGLGILVSTARGNYLYNATAIFDKAVNLTHADSEGENIELFGNTFLISSATDGDTLVLFKSAQTVFLSVGGSSPNPSQTVSVGSNTYTVELVAATDTSATIKVTDSSGASDQKEVNEAASKKILGVEVAVNLADESTATNTLSAEVIVGADRLTLEDASEVKIGSDQDTVDGTWVDFTGTVPDLTQITIQGFAEDTNSDFIQEGNDFVDPVFGAFRVLFSSLENNDASDRETISIDNSGSDKMSISFTDGNGDSVTNQNFINNESNAWGKAFLGDSSDFQIFTREMSKINVSATTIVGNEDEGRWIKLKTLTNGSTGFSSDEVKFENVLDTTETWTASITAEGSGTITIGGQQYGVTYIYDKLNGVSNAEYVQLDDLSGSTSASQMIVYPTIETSKGAKLAFVEPIAVDFGDWKQINRTGGFGYSNLTGLLFPDGDGYTTIAVTNQSTGTSANTNSTWLIGGQLLNLTAYDAVTTGHGSLGSVYVNVAGLTYNISNIAHASRTAVSAGIVGTSVVADNGHNSTAVIQLMDASNVTLNTPAVVLFEEQDESNNYEAVIITTSGAGTTNSGIGVSDVDFTWNKDLDMQGSAYGTGKQRESNDDLYDKMDQYGTLVTIDQSDSDQYSATISYPDEQVSAMVYIDAIGTGSGSTTLGDVKIMDDELSGSASAAKNLIVVGGSCVNTAASTLLGGSAACGSSWTAATGASSGEWIIQTFANPWGSSKVATLVAGWEQGDTANAATYLTTQNPVTTVGHKLTGTTGTAATVVTA